MARMIMFALGCVLFVSLGLSDLLAQRGPAPQIVWSPKTVKPGDWTPPHKPHTKLVDVLARHKGTADWVETVVDDDTLRADYISMAAGGKTPRRMNAEQGDIVYVPKQRWHLASFAGDGLSARLAMNGYPDLAHSFEANEGR